MDDITITPTAIEQIKKQLNQRGTPDSSIRLGVKGSGCNGFSYVLLYEDDPPRENRDLSFEIDGVHLIVDKKSQTFLKGTVLDWEKTLMYQGFKFINPNETSRCGCGSSFNVR